MHLLGLHNSILFLIGAGLAQALPPTTRQPNRRHAGAGGTTTGGTTAGHDGGSTTAGTTTEAGGARTSGTTRGQGGSTSTDTPSALPFVVDSLFTASGYMGDGATPPPTGGIAPIVQEIDMTCLATRPVGAVGHCHKFTYTPTAIASGGLSWGGVYWQYPVNNWGTFPGKRIAQGATKVTFYAARRRRHDRVVHRRNDNDGAMAIPMWRKSPSPSSSRPRCRRHNRPQRFHVRCGARFSPGRSKTPLATPPPSRSPSTTFVGNSRDERPRLTPRRVIPLRVQAAPWRARRDRLP